MSAPRYEFNLTGRQPQEPLPQDWFEITEEEARRARIGALDAGNNAEADRVVRIVAVTFITVIALMLVAIWFFLGIGQHAPPAGNDLLAPPATAGVKP